MSHILKNIFGLIGLKHIKDSGDSMAVQQKFNEHISMHGLSFGTVEEYEFRLAQYAQYDEEINMINAQPENTYTLGHNKFSTWTKAEFKQLLGRKKPLAQEARREEIIEDFSRLPTSVDWRTKGAVNPVQNQGRCGSCWAFASTAAMEGAHAIVTGSLPKLAEQQLVDCDRRSSGCNGGLEIWAYQYAEKHSMDKWVDYPYTGQDGSCNASSHTGIVSATTYAQPTSQSVKSVKASLAKGPTSVAVEADTSTWQFYQKGILNDASCGTNLDHAVMAVGYGVENGQGFAIIRNSWGASWGEQGYIRLAMDKDGPGICGFLLDTARPTTN